MKDAELAYCQALGERMGQAEGQPLANRLHLMRAAEDAWRQGVQVASPSADYASAVEPPAEMLGVLSRLSEQRSAVGGPEETGRKPSAEYEPQDAKAAADRELLSTWRALQASVPQEAKAAADRSVHVRAEQLAAELATRFKVVSQAMHVTPGTSSGQLGVMVNMQWVGVTKGGEVVFHAAGDSLRDRDARFRPGNVVRFPGVAEALATRSAILSDYAAAAGSKLSELSSQVSFLLAQDAAERGDIGRAKKVAGEHQERELEQAMDPYRHVRASIGSLLMRAVTTDPTASP